MERVVRWGRGIYIFSLLAPGFAAIGPEQKAGVSGLTAAKPEA